MSIGYACIISGSNDYKLKTCILKNASDNRLRELAFYNLNILEKMIDYNIFNGVNLFRISSDIIPFASHLVNRQEWWLENKIFLENLGTKIKNSNLRVSMHPGQYTVLNSPSPLVVERAIADLEYHTLFLDSLKIDSSSKIVLHIGGVYNDKISSIKRFEQSYSMLPQNIKDRLVIENDDKSYSIEDVLNIGLRLSIPVVFDNLHNKINPSDSKLTEYEWIKSCSNTWLGKDGRQKIHYSQQDRLGKSGAHSQTICIEEFMDFYKTISPLNLDIMLEVKDKNISAIECIGAVKSIYGD